MKCNFGKLIGSGAGSDVYEYGPDKVCKLYIDKYGIDMVNWEYKKTLDAYKNGLPTPKVYEIIEYNGRFGLVMEYIKGKTFNEVILFHVKKCLENGVSPYDIFYSQVFIGHIKDTAKILYELHQKKCDLVDTAKASLTRHCKNNSYLTQDEKKTVLKIIENLPEGNSVCHGDPNPNNLIYHDDKIFVIDWVNCVKGDPLYDITEYKLMTEYADDPIGLPNELVSFYLEHKNDIIQIFFDEYVRLSNMDISGIKYWIIPMLVSKMCGNNSDKKQKRLLDGIRNGLHAV